MKDGLNDSRTSTGQIVVGVDESEGAAAALRWAVREVELHGWRAKAVLAWDLLDQHRLDVSDGFDPVYDDEVARSVLAEAVVRAVGPDAAAAVRQEVVCDLPGAALVERSAEADLLVVGARGLGGFKSLLLGSVSRHCLHHAHCPVAVVRGHDGLAPTGALRTPERIVVGVDGSPTAQQALHWALREARLRGASVEVVHAWRPTAIGGPFPAVALDVTVLDAAAREILDTAIDREDATGLVVEGRVACEGAAAAILESAAAADLVVIGSRGHGRLARLLLGSVGEQVVHHAPCPVVVIRPRVPAP